MITVITVKQKTADINQDWGNQLDGTVHYGEVNRMSDLIDRQQAIDAVNEWFRLYVNRTMSNVTSIQDVLRQLPSVQPEERTEKRTKTHACDCISRQMLLEYIHGEPVGKLLCDKYNLDGLIEQFPSAQPEIIRCKDCKYYKNIRRTGRWFCSNDLGINTLETKSDDYCSNAERRTDEQTVSE